MRVRSASGGRFEWLWEAQGESEGEWAEHARGGRRIGWALDRTKGGWVSLILLEIPLNRTTSNLPEFDRTPVPFVFRVIRASLYASTIALSFFLMLVFMTYNVSDLRFLGPSSTVADMGFIGVSHCSRCHRCRTGALRLWIDDVCRCGAERSRRTKIDGLPLVRQFLSQGWY